MNTLDVTHEWDNPHWTKERIALLPMRLQPLHNGHLNLILSTAERFRKAIIMIAQTEISFDNPFTSQQRQDWVEQAKQEFNIYNIETSDQGSSQLSTIDEQIESYNKIAKEENFVFISGNNKVLEKCTNVYMFEHIHSLRIQLNAIINEIPIEMMHTQSHGRKIRESIYNNTDIPNGYLPKFIKLDEIRSSNS